MLDRWSARGFVICVSAIAAASCVNVEVPGATHEDVEIGTLTLEGSALADELAASPVREAPEAFVRVGMLWDADAPESIEISASLDGEIWTDWLAPVVHHVEVEHTSNFVGQVEFTLDAPAKFYRLRDGASPTATFLRMELLSNAMSESVENGDGPPEVAPRLVGEADVHVRADWGARSAACSSSLGTATRMTVHHTETPTNDSMSPAARLRQIQAYHMDVKGWCDIGYHYLMSRDGQLWEGRRDTLLGAHAGGNNTGNIGISVMGSHDATPITETQINSIAKLIKGISDQRGIAINRTKIKGHREYNPTTCPGDALLDQLDLILDVASGGDGPGDPPPGGGDCSLPNEGPWSCGGLTGTTNNASGGYFTTTFGCWVDSAGNNHGDAGDNCIPACSLSSIGCSGMTGPTCERFHNWYAADSDRFGCGTKIQVTNPDNGKAAVLIVIDRGPNCSIENIVDYWVLDMSAPASNHLFGGPTSASEHADVQVMVVDPSTPLGISGGLATCDGEDPPPPPTGEVTVIGVLYAGSDTANRIAGATVRLHDGRTVTTGPTGVWQFANVPTGEFSVTASAAGYQTRTITRTTYAPESWASFGLSTAAPTTGTAILQGVVYRTTNSANRIPNAQIALSTGQTLTTDGNGYYKVTNLPAGEITITASKSGFTTASVTRTLVDGQTEWGSVRLEP
jgi:hypothetical protein